MAIASSAIRIKESWILYSAFFALGMNLAVFYLPAFGLYLLVAWRKIILRAVSPNYLVLSALLLAATVPVYTIGYEDIELVSPLKSMLAFVLSTAVFGYFMQFRTAHEQANIIIFYVFGAAFIAIYIVGTSILIDPALYGYGRLYNPFTEEDMNSPGASNSLAMFSAVVVYMLFTETGKMYRLNLLVILLLTVAMAITLGGRAYFVILGVAFFVMAIPMIFRAKITPVLSIAVIVVLSVTAVSVTSERMEDFGRYYQLLSHRFESGLESSRFEHYVDGLSKFLLYPFGGFETDSAIEDTPYFHNVFLDNARLGGWIPVVALLLMVALVARSLSAWKHADTRFGLYVFFVSLLIMQQDVVVEGNSHLLVIVYYAAILVSRSKGSFGGKKEKPIFTGIISDPGLIRN